MVARRLKAALRSPAYGKPSFHLATRWPSSATASNVRSRQFSRKDYLGLFKTISTATASHDLKTGTDLGLLLKQGEKAMTPYSFPSGRP